MLAVRGSHSCWRFSLAAVQCTCGRHIPRARQGRILSISPVLAGEPVAMLGPLTRAGLQGLSPFLSRGLTAAISEVVPSMRAIPNHETVNAINGQGLAAEYADLISGFGRSGILERERLQKIGSALKCRYVLLPGLANFNQVLVDKF
jgi:hypothetical protein